MSRSDNRSAKYPIACGWVKEGAMKKWIFNIKGACLLLALLAGSSKNAHSVTCYQIWDHNNSLIYSATQPPFLLAGQDWTEGQERLRASGQSLLWFDRSTCPELDHFSKVKRERRRQHAAAPVRAPAQNDPLDLLANGRDGRDFLARPAAGLLTDVPPVLTPSTAPETVASQTAPDPFAPPQATSHRGSYLNRAAVGAIGGAALGALAGLFILVRALVAKFKAPATTKAMTIYRNRPQAMKIGAVLLLGCVAFIVYFLFIRTNTVDDYLNDYQGRLEKLQDCRGVPDMTKDRECMNAYTAQRMFMLR
jgi:hypothetical protein